MNFEERFILMNSFFTPRFSYCLLVLLHNRRISGKTNHLHEICSCTIYTDKNPSFEKHLETNKFVPVHIRNQQIFATGIFKVNRDFAPTIFSEFFEKRNIQYNMSHAFKFSVPDEEVFFMEQKVGPV